MCGGNKVVNVILNFSVRYTQYHVILIFCIKRSKSTFVIIPLERTCPGEQLNSSALKVQNIFPGVNVRLAVKSSATGKFFFDFFSNVIV